MVAVHLYADDDVWVVALSGTESTPIAEAPKNRAELVQYAEQRMKGWKAVPPPRHLHLVK